MRPAAVFSLILCSVCASLVVAQVTPAPEDEYLGANDDVPPLYTDDKPAVIAAEEIYIAQFEVGQIVDWCTQNVPSSTREVQTAGSEWLRLNRDVIALADRVRRDDSSVDSATQIENLAHMAIDPGAERLAAQPKEVQKKWCSRTAPGWILSKRFRRFDHPYVLAAFKDLAPQEQ